MKKLSHYLLIARAYYHQNGKLAQIACLAEYRIKDLHQASVTRQGGISQP